MPMIVCCKIIRASDAAGARLIRDEVRAVLLCRRTIPKPANFVLPWNAALQRRPGMPALCWPGESSKNN